MITSFIQGGLGNQLFQIAAGVSLAEKIGSEFCLHDGQHHLPLQGSRIETYKDNILKNIQFKDLGHVTLVPYRYDAPSYLPITEVDNQVLIGYFQSEKYFKEHRDLIHELFYLPRVPTPEGSVSIHVRRGDYLKNPDIHPALDASYYREALEVVGDYSKVYVFTDSDLPEGLELDNMEIVAPGKDYEHLALMASCDHNVIANSTYSWWAAYLNTNNNKVIAPKTWFGPKGPQGWDDIYCEGWIKI